LYLTKTLTKSGGKCRGFCSSGRYNWKLHPLVIPFWKCGTYLLQRQKSRLQGSLEFPAVHQPVPGGKYRTLHRSSSCYCAPSSPPACSYEPPPAAPIVRRDKMDGRGGIKVVRKGATETLFGLTFAFWRGIIGMKKKIYYFMKATATVKRKVACFPLSIPKPNSSK